MTSSKADASSPAEVSALFASAVRHLGGLDALVNNAGIAGPTVPVEDLGIEDWDRTIAVDLSGMFYCTRLAVPHLKAAGGGSIVNLSSIAGRLGYPRRSHYSAAKWGVTFEQAMSQFVAPISLRHMVSPGEIADMAVFLSSQSARSISGRALSVCGDHGYLA